jgi:hypothetical protein
MRCGCSSPDLLCLSLSVPTRASVDVVAHAPYLAAPACATMRRCVCQCACVCVSGACDVVRQSVRGAKRRSGSHRAQQLARHRRSPHSRSVRGAAVARREVFTCDARASHAKLASSAFCRPRSSPCACMERAGRSQRIPIPRWYRLCIFIAGAHERVSTYGRGLLAGVKQSFDACTKYACIHIYMRSALY